MEEQVEIKKEYSWVSYVLKRIKKDLNFLGIFIGPTGSGKSWSALSYAQMLDPDFTIEQVVFKGKDLMRLINSGRLKKGSVILWEEVGVELSSRSWQSKSNKMLNYLIQTFRHKNFILLFTVPYGDFVDTSTRKLFHAEFEMVSINRQKKTASVKPKLLQYNSQMKKWYYHYLKVIKKGTGISKIKRWAIKKPSDELLRQYEQLKIRYTTDLNLEIEENLNVANPHDKRKALTEQQERILEFWKRGEFVQKKIGELMGMGENQVSMNIKFMRNKGYFKENYRKSSQIAVNNYEEPPPTSSLGQVPNPTAN